MIPDAAVEAALTAIFPKGPISEFSRTTWERTVKEILEAAAPHMLAALADSRDGELFRFTWAQREWLRGANV